MVSGKNGASIIGPYNEGSSLYLTCRVSGGKAVVGKSGKREEKGIEGGKRKEIGGDKTQQLHMYGQKHIYIWNGGNT